MFPRYVKASGDQNYLSESKNKNCLVCKHTRTRAALSQFQAAGALIF